MRPQNTFGEYTVSSLDGQSQTFPTFTCGHCSNITVMHAFRERPRNLCFACQKWICEEKELCNLGCTPLSRLADDNFELSPKTRKYGEFVPAIMAGASTLDEAHSMGIVITDLT